MRHSENILRANNKQYTTKKIKIIAIVKRAINARKIIIPYIFRRFDSQELY